MEIVNKQIVLNKPILGTPGLEHFKLLETPLRQLNDGEILLRTLQIGIDPIIQKLSRPQKGFSSINNIKPGDIIHGTTVSEVEESRNPNFQVGERVMTNTGWQNYCILKPILTNKFPWGKDLVKKIPQDVATHHFLSILGMTGLTACVGLSEIGRYKPGETVVVSSAAGAVGMIVGQLAKQNGCNVVGIVGSESKCDYVVNTLGFDSCLNFKSKTFLEDLKTVCPQRVDVFFDLVGGPIFYAVLSQLNEHGRVICCGSIAWASYDGDDIPQGPDITALMQFSFIPRNITIQGFIVLNYLDKYEPFLEKTIPKVQSKTLKDEVHLIKKLENGPQGFIDLLAGKLTGKLIIEI